jgi:hypothetical protein
MKVKMKPVGKDAGRRTEVEVYGSSCYDECYQ